MKKRILAAVLASASILGAVAGCSSNATSSAGSSTTDSSKTDESSRLKNQARLMIRATQELPISSHLRKAKARLLTSLYGTKSSRITLRST